MMILFLLGLLGCSDISLTEKQLGERLQIYPEQLDFGILGCNIETGYEEVLLINTGTEPYELVELSQLGSTEFELACEDCAGTELLPNGVLPIGVLYNPVSLGEVSGELSIDGYTVELLGFGDGSELLVEPDVVDFGTIEEGCVVDQTITMTNVGTRELWVDNIALLSGEFSVELGSLSGENWPLWISGAGRREFDLEFDVDSIGYRIDKLWIDWHDSYHSHQEEVDISGEGVGDVWHTEDWIQTEEEILDVLLVIDDSGSMRLQQSNLGNNIGLFMQEFILSGADYHMGVITTSYSMLNGWVSSHNPNAVMLMEQLTQVGITGIGNEMGIFQSWECLYNLASGDCISSGFWRVQSDKAIIYISDEEDQSPDVWSVYNSDFQNENNFRAYGIIGDMPNGCSGVNYSAQAGGGYAELINANGGSYYSICSNDWGLSLGALSGTLVGRSEFELNHTNINQSSIVVKVNGQVVTDWVYIESINVVKFNQGAVPEAGDNVSIEYRLEC